MSRASELANLTVWDLKSSLDYQEDNENGDLPFTISELKQALAIVIRRGEKTSAKILLARIARYEKAAKK